MVFCTRLFRCGTMLVPCFPYCCAVLWSVVLRDDPDQTRHGCSAPAGVEIVRSRRSTLDRPVQTHPVSGNNGTPITANRSAGGGGDSQMPSPHHQQQWQLLSRHGRFPIPASIVHAPRSLPKTPLTGLSSVVSLRLPLLAGRVLACTTTSSRGRLAEASVAALHHKVSWQRRRQADQAQQERAYGALRASCPASGSPPEQLRTEFLAQPPYPLPRRVKCVLQRRVAEFYATTGESSRSQARGSETFQHLLLAMRCRRRKRLLTGKLADGYVSRMRPSRKAKSRSTARQPSSLTAR